MRSQSGAPGGRTGSGQPGGSEVSTPPVCHRIEQTYDRTALLQGPAASVRAVGGRRVLLQLMQSVSAAVRASSPATSAAGAAAEVVAGAAFSTGWPTAVKS